LDRADRAALRLSLGDVLADLETERIVVRAEIGLAQRHVGLGQVRVDGHDRDRRIGRPDRLGDQRRVRGRNRNASRIRPAEDITDDLSLARFVRRRGRPGIGTLIVGVWILRIPLQAALVHRLEIRIVEALDDNDELLLGSLGLAGAKHKRRRGGQQYKLLHGIPPLSSKKTSAAPLAGPTSPSFDKLANNAPRWTSIKNHTLAAGALTLFPAFANLALAGERSGSP